MNMIWARLSVFLFLSLLAACVGQEPARRQVASPPLQTPQDDPLRKLWETAEQGVPEAQLKLGKAFEKGNGVPADHAQAQIWYERAALKGNAEALHRLSKASILTCENGQRFIINFNRDGETAQILIDGENMPQFLANNHVGAGTEYESADGNYVFAEHYETTTLTISGKTTKCRKDIKL